MCKFANVMGVRVVSRIDVYADVSHSGGLVRNLFSPVFHGGSTICCTGFDSNQFWDIVEESHPTWYYASPTMHQAILEAGADRPEAQAKLNVRLVCNAAGGLLPSLAVRLRDLFHCTVLPSYGMTECMPISTPPLDYTLDRPGTSGISCGPEMTIFDGNDRPMPPHEVGRICVRGSPLFPGYLKTTGLDKSAFMKGGWFDTGDMGYLDEDKYLYVTGRSKEVINRGGELISPFEIEEAIMTASRDPNSSIYGRVAETLAYSAPHEILQEAVGVVIVTPEGVPRIDLRLLQASVKSSLHSTKWPVTMVFMNGVPKNANNKVLRIKLGERFSYPNLVDEIPVAELHFEAENPPHNSALTVKIPKEMVYIDHDAAVDTVQHFTDNQFDVYSNTNEKNGLVDMVLAPRFPGEVPFLDIEDLRQQLEQSIDGYLVPNSIKKIDVPFPLTDEGSIDMPLLYELLKPVGASSGEGSGSATELKIRGLFANLLSCTVEEVGADTDFFQAGGDSMKAGRLLSLLRKEFDVRIPIGDLFSNSTVRALCAMVGDVDDGQAEKKTREKIPLPGCTKTYSSKNPILLILQLIPLAIVYPMKRALEWTCLLYMLSNSITWWPHTPSVPERFVTLLLSIFVARNVTQIVPPLLAIALKWIIIGRYKEGIYPMWGSYHTRWWITQKLVAIGGKGFFKNSNYLRVTYFRLLGAHIGKGVTIDNGATLGEYDLIEIGDNSNLDRCLCRPFAAERNTSMYLGRIIIGTNCSVGLKSTIAAGTFMPNDTCIGPNSSSWEMKDATEANRDLSASKIAQPPTIMKVLFAWPLLFIFKLVSMAPWMAGLVGLVLVEPSPSNDELRSVVIWFSTPTRVGYHFLARLLGAMFGSLFFVICVITFKRTMDAFCGKLAPGPSKSRSSFEKFRLYLYRLLLSGWELSDVRENFGSHYESTSILVRLLGGKVGRHVYWPGSGPSIQDYDFIDIGNDVVFGSRAAIVTSDGEGTYPVRVGDGNMVADRVVLLPGCSSGKKTVFGSGALARRDTHYPSDTTWVGSQGGGAVNLTTGRAQMPQSTASSDFALSSGTITPGYKDIETGKGAAFDKLSGYGSNTSSMVGPPDYNDTFSDRAEFAHDISGLDMEKKRAYATETPASSITLVNNSPPADESTPFGRAFYEGKAPYHVLGVWSIAFYSTMSTVITSVYWNTPTVVAVQAVALLFHHDVNALKNHGWWRPFVIYGIIAAMVSAILTIQAIVATVLMIAAKWALMGRRMPGSYDWDKSSYCQRWQIYLTMERLRRRCYGGMGIIGMLTGTHYAVMYMRALGAKIGDDCALFAGGMPSLLFTEPDLLTLGDRVCVDDASLVGHINSRGNFNLNPLVVGSRSVLRSGSRLLSGAQMSTLR